MRLGSAIMPLLLAAAGLSAARAADLTVRVFDSSGRPLPEAVVYLRGPAAGSVPPPAQVTIDQKNKQFVPKITVITVGTAVTFPNSDQIRHSVYSFSEAKTFTIKLYAGKPKSPVVFDREGIVALGCNIHDQMAASVVVVDTPIFGKTDSSGAIVFRGIRQASYELNAWYPGMESGPLVQTLSAGGQGPPQLDVRLPVDSPGSPSP